MKFDFTNMLKGIKEWDRKITKATELYAETAAEKMVAEAKKNKPWKPKTHLSHQTIDYKIVKLPNKVQIQLRGNTPHFKYLELCHEKKNAILWPTIKKNSSEVIKGWAKIVSGLK